MDIEIFALFWANTNNVFMSIASGLLVASVSVTNLSEIIRLCYISF